MRVERVEPGIDRVRVFPKKTLVRCFTSSWAWHRDMYMQCPKKSVRIEEEDVIDNTLDGRFPKARLSTGRQSVGSALCIRDVKGEVRLAAGRAGKHCGGMPRGKVSCSLRSVEMEGWQAERDASHDAGSG